MGKEPPSGTKENYVMFTLSIIHIRRDRSRSIHKCFDYGSRSNNDSNFKKKKLTQLVKNATQK